MNKETSKVTSKSKREVSNMIKKYLIVGIALLGFLASVVPAHAGVLGNDSVGASATVSQIKTLSLVTKNVSNNQPTTSAKTVAFGTLSGSVANAPTYVELTYGCNSAIWSVYIYTNNTTADATVAELKYQKAGLLRDDNKARVPLYWCAYKNPQTPETLTLTATGVPTTRTSSALTGALTVTDWSVLKDKNDLDDTTTTAVNESWIYAFSGDGGVTSKGGYCNVVFGGPSYSNITAVPYYDKAPETTGTYDVDPAKNTLHRPGTSPVIVYVAAGGGFAPAGTYATNIGFDLYQE